MTSVIDHRHSSRLWSHWPNSIHFTQRCMFGAKTRNDDQNNLSSIKSIKWVIFCLYHLIYDITHFSHLVQCKIKLNLQILLFTPSFIVFFGQKWLIPQIADMLYASLIYRRQIKSAMIFPALRFSKLSKWLFFFNVNQFNVESSQKLLCVWKHFPWWNFPKRKLNKHIDTSHNDFTQIHHISFTNPIQIPFATTMLMIMLYQDAIKMALMTARRDRHRQSRQVVKASFHWEALKPWEWFDCNNLCLCLCLCLSIGRLSNPENDLIITITNQGDIQGKIRQGIFTKYISNTVLWQITEKNYFLFSPLTQRCEAW